MLLASVPDELFGKVDSGTTAWMLMSAALVLLMTPALAFFYGGLSRQKSVLNMMMMSIGSLGLVSVIYVLWGYSMSFSGEGNYLGLFDNPFKYFGLDQLMETKPSGEDTLVVLNAAGSGLPAIVFAGFQLTFAVITVALISGALAERVKFGTWLLFTGIWTTIVYLPLAHMVWGGGLLSGAEGGIAAKMFGTTDGHATVAPIDFAGGTVVHINAGIAGLVLAIIVGKRLGFGKHSYRPHNIPFVMLGAALLWFGWFGFNAGSALGANATAGLAWVNTTAATAAAMLGWLAVEKFRDGHATTVGAASGVVAGLVAITPACANVTPVGALILGVVAGVAAAFGVGLKSKFGFDDSLDVVGVHLVAGVIGTVALGFLAKDTGLFYGGDYKQLVVQIVIAAVALAFTAILTAVIAFALKPLGWRIDKEEEADGIDNSEHAETAYDLV
ncbi:ammonium transporter [Tsukamurella ocularis]|uniref:ammonium transporter n=1 Tax=Tsukamurella ocularis TaxID=1970234 RepID=UPI002168D2E0|nr:ammonium transporter [Tsukamurella ocularis]MCS3780313.1 Amt family ammonium transporter [Tsukamurella ocularis]MCS3786132.1 Amt family ammonium transporter [Tsukamurella ocularis]MCS3849496.1 Amt family ammonium transporter [Tsukamurella ocularis]